MGKNKEPRVKGKGGKSIKKKKICCEKYLRKGKHCKGCPDMGCCEFTDL